MKSTGMFVTLVTLATIVVPATHAAENPVLSLDQVLEQFQWDLESTAIRTEKVTDSLYVLFGAGGNIAVSIGSDGVLVVDNQFPEMYGKIKQAIQALGGDRIDYAVNTHWHFDHAQGNLAMGPDGVNIVAHQNAREDMKSGGVINMVIAKHGQKPYPSNALPVITYADGMHMYFNDEQIDLMHFSPAHTTGDTAIIFRGSNAVHLGDVFNNSGYPFIDADSGGDIDGMIEFCQSTLDQIPANATVIPGHGEITDTDALKAYISMLRTVRGRVAKMMSQGKSLEEIEAANLTAEYTDAYGDESASLGFVNRIYTSLAKKK